MSKLNRIVFAVKAFLAAGLVVAGVAGPASASNVSCKTTRYNTVGRIDCVGNGWVRIIVDCKSPQVTDCKGERCNGTFQRIDGNLRQYGECNFGINTVNYEVHY